MNLKLSACVCIKFSLKWKFLTIDSVLYVGFDLERYNWVYPFLSFYPQRSFLKHDTSYCDHLDYIFFIRPTLKGEEMVE